ncbi:MAG: helix-turn-helix domain-containing protein [Reyranellaceae bacterium]
MGGLLALSAAAYACVWIVGVNAWSWPILLIAMGTPALLWTWTGAVFADEFRASWRDAVAWLILPGLGAFGLHFPWPWVGIAENLLSLLFVLLAAWRILSGLRGDLVERRRRFRPFLASLAVLYTGATLLMEVLGTNRQSGASGRVAEAAALAALATTFALVALRAGRSPFGPTVESVAPSSSIGPTPTPATDPQEDALLARLQRLMQEEKVYRQEGFGVPALVAAIDVPEYRLRRLINQRLGHRNFSSFVNSYRLAEAMAALADPTQAGVPVLTIALDAGFQSIGPFNRAFKAHTGVTPTAYRKHADSRTEGSIRENGQQTSQFGET